MGSQKAYRAYLRQMLAKIDVLVANIHSSDAEGQDTLLWAINLKKTLLLEKLSQLETD